MSSGTALKKLVIPPKDAADPWRRRAALVAYGEFGKGSRKNFDWYFKGKSKIAVKSFSDVTKWLLKCQYVEDIELFLEDDFWQHPVTFEATKKGDCEDHALWAWRKLVELDYHVEFVSGVWNEGKPEFGKRTGHAWVMFKDKESGLWRILEATHKSKASIVLTLEQASTIYQPRVSIDQNLKTYRYFDTKLS